MPALIYKLECFSLPRADVRSLDFAGHTISNETFKSVC